MRNFQRAYLENNNFQETVSSKYLFVRVQLLYLDTTNTIYFLVSACV